MKKQRTRICSRCGKEFVISKKNRSAYCPDCQQGKSNKDYYETWARLGELDERNR
jgi:ribosomal protein L37E